LDKGFEHFRHLSRTHTDTGIADGEHHDAPPRIGRFGTDCKFYASLRSEFHCVVQQVRQDLFDPGGITYHKLGDRIVLDQLEIQSLLPDQPGLDRDAVLKHLIHRKGDGLQSDPPLLYP